MIAGRDIKLAAAAALAAATALASVAALVALNGGGAVKIGAWRPLELAAGYDRAADALVRTARPADLRRAEALSRRAIALHPYDIGAWLRIAYVEAQVHGKLTPAGIAALRRSYDLVAYDPDEASWRIAFALQHWADLPADLKAAVRAEAMSVGSSWRHRARIVEVLKGVTNPAARLTAMLWVSQIERTKWR
jgi:hypothetical protein